jgi:rhamnosyltransferase subunit B
MPAPALVLSTFGTLGDVLPFVWIVRALRRRGYRIRVLASPEAGAWFEGDGVEVVRLGAAQPVGRTIQEHPEILGRFGGWHALEKLYVPFTQALFPATRDAIEELAPAAVIAHAACYGSIWAARQSRTPVGVVHLMPASWFSGWRALRELRPPWLRRVLGPLVHFGAECSMEISVRRAARRLGVATHRDLLRRSTLEAPLVLGLWSAAFRPPEQGDPRTGIICGFPVPPSQPLPVEIEAFLAEPGAVVGVSFGGSASPVAGPLYRMAIESARALGVRLLLLCPPQAQLEKLPSFALRTSYAPYEDVIPRCSAFVHHGGIGTTGIALRSGSPSVVIPFGQDQFNNAARAEDLGVARVLRRSRVGPEPLARALASVLAGDVTACARSLGARLRLEPDGTEVAAGAIAEKFVGSAA